MAKSSIAALNGMLTGILEIYRRRSDYAKLGVRGGWRDRRSIGA
jgi:hypothetical protein